MLIGCYTNLDYLAHFLSFIGKLIIFSKYRTGCLGVSIKFLTGWDLDMTSGQKICEAQWAFTS